MRGYVRPLLLVASLLGPDLFVAAPAGAEGVYLPAAPTGPGGEDTIETASGTRCRQSINSNGAYLDVGVAGHAASGVSPYASLFPQPGNSGSDATGYARLTVPLGKRPQRIDCSRIYELEIARMKREIELLEMAAQ